MDNGFVTIGHYICPKTETPSYLGFDTDSFISVSDCLSDHEPQIVYCHGRKLHGDDPQYISRYFSDREDYIKMSGEIWELFSQELFDMDGRFLRKKDAVYFYKKYFASYDCTLVAVSTKERYSAFSSDNSDQREYERLEDEGGFIGCDLIGWDISGFHSFLCNSLHEEFDDISFNKYGLLDESFEKAEQMAEKIQGMGEPVDWIPVMIHKLY